MTDPAQELLDLLNIENLDIDLFRGIGVGGETSIRIFGGHVIAQSLMAAYRTVPQDRTCHSLHAYFIRAGDTSRPVIYQVDRARDGGSFTTRRVVAMQNGKQIFNMSASFHVHEEGWEHQHPMQQVEGPEGVKNRAELRSASADLISDSHRSDFLRVRPIEIRTVAPLDFQNPPSSDDTNHLWFRMEAAKGCDARTQHCLLAYASDLDLLGSALRPHGVNWFQGKVMTASLDHALWFHAPIQFDQWHLYAMDSPFSGAARGFNRGAIYTQDGKLVASVAQEGLLRPVRPKE